MKKIFLSRLPIPPFLLLKIVIIGAVFASLSCTYRNAPPPLQFQKEALSRDTQITDKEDWEVKWRKTLAGANKEGKLVLHTDQSPDVRQALIDNVRKKFGLDLEIVSAKGGQLAEKVMSERRAGLYTVDIAISGTDTPTHILKPAGVLESIEQELILPEVLDPQAWFEGRVPFFNRDRTIFSFAAWVNDTILRNTDLVQKDEIKSYKDLLNPKWKGKFLWLDPFMRTGSGEQFARIIGAHIMGNDFMRELAKQQPVMTQDKRLVIEWVARGKYPISFGASTSGVLEFKNAGAPVEEFSPVEGGYLTSGGSAGNFYIYKNPPHPQARKIFINWLLSKEGQTLWTQVAGVQSARVDVPTNHLNPKNLRQPGKKYVSTISEEWTSTRDKELDIILDILRPWVK